MQASLPFLIATSPARSPSISSSTPFLPGAHLIHRSSYPGASEPDRGSPWTSVAVGLGLGLGRAAQAAIGQGQPRRRHGRASARASLAACRAAASTDTEASTTVEPFLDGPKMRVVVFGGTGYIGRAVVKELERRGHSVVLLTRDKSGIGGAQSVDDVRSSMGGDIDVLTGDVADAASLGELLGGRSPAIDAAVCCLASRSGGKQDSMDIDYQATVNCMSAARAAGLKHFVLLSAICVQRPKLSFQRAKLQAEAMLQEHAEEMSYSIVRATAYFKSIVGQVKKVRDGGSFVMFGDGQRTSCKPISEEDLASFIADCLWDPAKRNQILPIGGPGDALSFREQGELIFELAGKEPKFVNVPFWLFGMICGLVEFFTGKDSDKSEYARIGRYYAEESMLVYDSAKESYSSELTPGYGKRTLRAFLTDALREGSTLLDEQKLGDQALGSRLGKKKASKS